MTNKEYNGYYNVETWMVALWIDNEKGSQEYWREEAEQAIKMSHGDEDSARNTLEDWLRASHEENQPQTTGLWADLLNAALSEVNWREIAKNMIDEVLAEQNA